MDARTRAVAKLESLTGATRDRVAEVLDAALRSIGASPTSPDESAIMRASVLASDRLDVEEKDRRNPQAPFTGQLARD